ncbi:hypothetical protein BGX23_007375 [Mortierella sp. AD031]|nr:hypothetical protein BGX23_007375 [Mortierella sp. AD031]KAG0206992.1 hypothetical protein BGX33_007076 [Mortierella sp. NVP41]
MAFRTGMGKTTVHTPFSRSLSSTIFIALSTLTLILALLTFTVDAQSPIARRRLAYVQYNNQLYLQGGITQAGVSNQLNALDLTTPWSTASPSWKMLAGGNWVSHHTMVAVKPEHAAGIGSGAEGYLLAIGGNPMSVNGFWTAYDIQAGTWTNLTAMAPYIGLEGHSAVADPTTGQVYIVGGYYNNAATNSSVANRLTIYDPTTNSVVFQQAATDKNNLTGVVAVWSTKRNTILTFGGSRALSGSVVSGLPLVNLDEYDPASKIWKTMSTTGNIPTRVLDACAAASDDGSKIILFGGSLDANTFFSTIYILDVVTGVWTQGESASEFRARMGCGYHAGQFIVYGGSRGTSQTTSMHNNLPIIYNPDANSWSTNFDPKGPAGGGGGGGGESGKKNLGPIIGAVAGGLVFLMICAAGWFCFNKRRRAIKDKEATDSEAKAAAAVSNRDGDDRRGQHALLAKYNDESTAQDHLYGGNGSTMSAADHYAAAAALQVASNNNAMTSARASSRMSDTFSHGTSDNDYVALMPIGGALAAGGSSETASQADAANYYYQQMQLQQLQQLQQQQPYQQQFQQQQQQYANMSPTYSTSSPSYSSPAPNQSPHGDYTTVPVVIQQRDGATQGPHSWTGSYYDATPPVSGNSQVPAVPPVPYYGGVQQQQQPWVPSNGYYGTTTSSTPMTPGFPPIESPSTAGGSTAGNEYHNQDGYAATKVASTTARAPQVVAPGTPSDYVRPHQ